VVQKESYSGSSQGGGRKGTQIGDEVRRIDRGGIFTVQSSIRRGVLLKSLSTTKKEHQQHPSILKEKEEGPVKWKPGRSKKIKTDWVASQKKGKR